MGGPLKGLHSVVFGCVGIQMVFLPKALYTLPHSEVGLHLQGCQVPGTSKYFAMPTPSEHYAIALDPSS